MKVDEYIRPVAVNFRERELRMLGPDLEGFGDHVPHFVGIQVP